MFFRQTPWCLPLIAFPLMPNHMTTTMPTPMKTPPSRGRDAWPRAEFMHLQIPLPFFFNAAPQRQRSKSDKEEQNTAITCSVCFPLNTSEELMNLRSSNPDSSGGGGVAGGITTRFWRYHGAQQKHTFTHNAHIHTMSKGVVMQSNRSILCLKATRVIALN